MTRDELLDWLESCAETIEWFDGVYGGVIEREPDEPLTKAVERAIEECANYDGEEG